MVKLDDDWRIIVFATRGEMFLDRSKNAADFVLGGRKLARSAVDLDIAYRVKRKEGIRVPSLLTATAESQKKDREKSDEKETAVFTP